MLRRNARSWPCAVSSSSAIVSMLRARLPSSSSGILSSGTRADRLPAAISPAVVCIAAIGRVSRRARSADTIAATARAIAPVTRNHPPACPSGRLSTSCVTTRTGVRSPTAARGRATNAVSPATPDCVSPASSASRSRSSVARPLGRSGMFAAVSHRLPRRLSTPSSTAPSGSTTTRLPSEMRIVAETRRHARVSAGRPSAAGLPAVRRKTRPTTSSSRATSGACAFRSLTALSVAVSRASPAAPSVASTRTPNAMATIATSSRVRRRRRGRLTAAAAGPTRAGSRLPAPW